MSVGKLPEGWEAVNLGSLINLSTGKLDANAADNDGQYPFFTCAESISQIKSWAFDTSAVLLAGNGSFSIKKYTGKFNAYQRTYVIEPILIKTEFLYWLIRGNIRKITENGRGSTIPYIRKGDITDIIVALPSLSEQTLIADKLDTLLAQVDSTKARLEQIPKILKRFRQAILISAVNGRLTKEYHQNGIFGVQTSLGELILNGPQNGLYKPSKFYGEGVKIIRIDSFYDGKILSFDNLKKVDISTDEKNRWQLYENDILINRVNSIEYLGKCAHVKMLSEDVVFESNIMRLSIDTTKISPEYLTLFLCSAAGIKELRKNAKLAVNQASINQTDVKNCKLTLPTLTAQHEIVRRVEQLFAYADTIEKQVNNALTRVNSLTQSILAKAFRGELTAQWRAENPSLISGENSAAALLEKIKAERAASGGKKTSRKRA
ncbi:restriction endonuclease subunit S [Citrobacter freundii]|nr:restriction endonuclease subunit S [Citrobacter freundii]MBM3009251.1 restriction endonuclease subunit S [Citrobacter freundii]